MAERPDYSDCRILLVDDDQDFVLILLRCLEKLGVPREQIRVCSEGRAAMDLLEAREWRPSFVLLDHKLPLRTGLEVLEWLRSREASRDIAVFMLSTGSEPDLIRKAFQLGASAFYLKPLGFAELVRNLEEMLECWRTGGAPAPLLGSLRPDGSPKGST